MKTRVCCAWWSLGGGISSDMERCALRARRERDTRLRADVVGETVHVDFHRFEEFQTFKDRTQRRWMYKAQDVARDYNDNRLFQEGQEFHPADAAKLALTQDVCRLLGVKTPIDFESIVNGVHFLDETKSEELAAAVRKATLLEMSKPKKTKRNGKGKKRKRTQNNVIEQAGMVIHGISGNKLLTYCATCKAHCRTHKQGGRAKKRVNGVLKSYRQYKIFPGDAFDLASRMKS